MPPTPPARCAGARRWLLLAFVLQACAGWAVVAAQPLSDAASEALRRAQSLAAQAQATYPQHFPDQPLWAAALDAGREAAEAAPGHPAPQRFLAQVYGRTSWHARAWDAWQAYLELGGELDAAAAGQLLTTALWLGLNAFDQGWPEPARRYLEAVVAIDPAEPRAHERLARLAMERGEPLAALPHLVALGDALPADLRPALAAARRVERFGAAAVASFEAGRAAVARSAPSEALTHYRAAAAAAGGFVDAWRGVATTALAVGRPAEAADALERVLVLEPGDGAARASLATARAQLAFGVEAQRAFARGVAAYEAGTLITARTAFEAAVAQNPGYVDAIAWLGRIAAETGDLATAAARYRSARALAPNRADLAQALAAVEARLAEAAAGAATAAEAAAAAAARARAEAEATAEAEARAAEAAAATAAAAEAAAAAAADAPWVVLLDATIGHEATSAGGSGAVTFRGTPHLLRDLARFRTGTLHARLDVRSKPSGDPVRYQLCLVPEDILVAPACTAPGSLEFTTSGTFDLAVRLAALSGAGAVDWRRGIGQVMLVLRQPDGSPIDDRLLPGQTTRAPLDAERYYPMEVRVSLLVVESGGAFPGWP